MDSVFASIKRNKHMLAPSATLWSPPGPTCAPPGGLLLQTAASPPGQQHHGHTHLVSLLASLLKFCCSKTAPSVTSPGKATLPHCALAQVQRAQQAAQRSCCGWPGRADKWVVPTGHVCRTGGGSAGAPGHPAQAQPVPPAGILATEPWVETLPALVNSESHLRTGRRAESGGLGTGGGHTPASGGSSLTPVLEALQGLGTCVPGAHGGFLCPSGGPRQALLSGSGVVLALPSPATQDPEQLRPARTPRSRDGGPGPQHLTKAVSSPGHGVQGRSQPWPGQPALQSQEGDRAQGAPPQGLSCLAGIASGKPRATPQGPGARPG